MKHKHCDLIKAWADGAEIEVKVISAWVSCESPSWLTDREYRIKPKTLNLNIELSADQAEALFELLNLPNVITKSDRYVKKAFDSYLKFWAPEAENDTRHTFVKPLTDFVADIRNDNSIKIS